MPYGHGRLAVFGEAAIFTAQIEDTNGNRIGFTVPGAEGNKQFVLNVAHWLAGLVGPSLYTCHRPAARRHRAANA